MGKAFDRPPASFKDDGEIKQWVLNTITGFDPGPPPGNPYFQANCFVAASGIIGPDQQRIATILGISPDDTALWAANLRRNGVWKGSAVECERWYEENGGWGAFMWHTLAAIGKAGSSLNDAGEASNTA